MYLHAEYQRMEIFHLKNHLSLPQILQQYLSGRKSFDSYSTFNFKKKRNYRQILHLGQEPSAKDTNFHILSDSLLAKHSVIIQIMVSFHSLMSDLLCFITELNNIANELARDP